MRRPKLSPDVARLGGRYPAGVLENPKPIAQRFAHSADLREASLRVAEPPLTSQPAPPSVEAREATASTGSRSPVRTRRLIMSLVVAVLLPSLILGALWLGSTGKTQPPPAAQAPEPQTLARLSRAHVLCQDRSRSGRDCELCHCARWHRWRPVSQRHRHKGTAAKQQFLRGPSLWRQRMGAEA